MDSERKLNLERICRTCMKENEDMKNLFDTSHKLRKLLLYCSDLQICENDGLPPQICEPCVNLAKNAETFKKQCKNSERELREYMGLQASPQTLHIKSEEKIHKTDLPCDDKAVKYECLWCIEKFNDDYDFNLHLGVHTEKSDHKCHICECFFTTSSSLTEHVDVHKTKARLNACMSAIKNEYADEPETYNSTMLDPINCILDPNYDVKYARTDHENTLTDLKMQCIESTSKVKGLRTSSKKKFQCKMCEQYFKRKFDLSEHLQAEHEIGLRDNEKFRKCPHCNNILHSYWSLRKHIQEAHKSNLLECSHCPSIKKYYSAYGLKRHQVSHQDLCLDADSGLYECKICIEQFSDYDELSKHVGNHLENSANECHNCRCFFKSNINLQQHIKYHKETGYILQMKAEDSVLADGDTEQKILVIKNADPPSHLDGQLKNTEGNCPSDIDYMDDEYLPIARLKEEAKDLVKNEEDEMAKSDMNICLYCNQRFKREIWLHKHMYQAHNILAPGLKKEDLEKQQLKCPECDKLFRKNVFLMTHMLRVHNLTEFKCLECPKTFQKYIYLIEHQKRHTGAKSYLCPECGRGFFKQNQLTRHLITHGKEKSERPTYPCSVCGRVLHFLNHLQVHMRCHRKRMPDSPAPDSKKSILCATCGASCSSRSNLAVHMRRHTGTVTCRCDLCGKGYPRTTDLTLHMRKHTGERPFVCQVCNRGFARSDKLSIHMRIHTGERPYVCQNCGRAYIQSNDLALHRKRNNCIPLVEIKNIKPAPTETSHTTPPNENLEIVMNVADATLEAAENENVTEVVTSLPNITLAVATDNGLNSTSIDTRNLITIMEGTKNVSDFMKQNILVPNLLVNGTNNIVPLEFAAGNTGILQQKVDFSDYAASLLSVQSFAQFNSR